MPELLIELLSEEIPARMQARAASQLETSLLELAQSMGFSGSIAHKAVRGFATPRRLVGVVSGLPAEQPDRDEERRGPRADAPEKAVQGFARSCGVALDALSIVETEKGAYYTVRIVQRGRPSAEVLAEKLPEMIRAFPWPKSMRWGERGLRWVRPLSSILCVFDGRVVPFELEPGLRAGALSRGHRFLAPEPFEAADFAGYESGLRRSRVVLSAEERRKMIREQAEALAGRQGLTVASDPALVAENAGLVEWPVALMGAFDDAFMALPPEVLTSAMRTHQKYFSLLKPDGRLSNHFVLVANIETADGGERILAGNQRVLRARLADAKFFWEQDHKRRFADRVDALSGITFHAKLGSLGRKVGRLRRLAPIVARAVAGADARDVDRAAFLCKADLTTEMVGEFPELQGIMGRYYALDAHEPAAVADAIADHYSPLGPDDDCPSAPVSVVLALTDKIDTLVGFFAIGERPTGSKDPFALRRAALGVIRLLIENEVRLPLRRVFAAAYGGYDDRFPQPGTEGGPEEGEVERLFDTLLAFFAERLKVHLKEQGVRHDLVAAVFEKGGEDDLVRLLAKVAALDDFLKTDDGANLLVAYRRGANILRIEEKKDGRSYDGAPDAGLLRAEEERALAARLFTAEQAAGAALGREDFIAAMAAMAGLRTAVDGFFERVTVNCDDADMRLNRLRLLSGLRAALDSFADFSRIEG